MHRQAGGNTRLRFVDNAGVVSHGSIDRPDPDAADLIEAARAHFDAGEFRRSAEVALEAAEVAASVQRPDLIVEAAMLSTGVARTQIAAWATQERLSDDADP